MSEKSHHSHEHGHDKIELDSTSKEVLDKLAEKGRESAEKHAEKIKETLEDIRAEAREKAKAADEILGKREEEFREPDAPMLVNKDLKSIKYKRTLQSVQKDLKPAERVLSKVMHNEKVDAISEIAGKTIARPSGFLTGSIFAFVGSSVFLWVTKHYGYEYNFLFFVMLFAAGFALGLLVELMLRMANRKSR
jgi:Ca2+-dependent lipid-binding protein